MKKKLQFLKLIKIKNFSTKALHSVRLIKSLMGNINFCFWFYTYIFIKIHLLKVIFYKWY